jgi:hypothetical protein
MINDAFQEFLRNQDVVLSTSCEIPLIDVEPGARFVFRGLNRSPRIKISRAVSIINEWHKKEDSDPADRLSEERLSILSQMSESDYHSIVEVERTSDELYYTISPAPHFETNWSKWDIIVTDSNGSRYDCSNGAFSHLAGFDVLVGSRDLGARIPDLATSIEIQIYSPQGQDLKLAGNSCCTLDLMSGFWKYTDQLRY